MPYIGRTLGQGTRSRFLYTATAGQTTFSGSDTQSNTLAYADNNGLDCFQNGVLLKGGGADYTATSGTSVVLTTGASVSDVIEILVYDVFAIADHVKKSGDTMTGQLNANGGAVFNEDSADVDFRVESNGNANMLVIDGGSDIMSIGRAVNSSSTLAIQNKDDTNNNAIDVFNDNGNRTFSIQSNTSGDAQFKAFKNDGTQTFTLDGSGNVFVNCTSTGGTYQAQLEVQTTGGSRIIQTKSAITGNTNALTFNTPSGQAGAITTNTTSTTYSTSSDYRLKENVTTSWDATSRIKQLKPSRFNFKADKDRTVDGFLAHEVSSIVPEAIIGKKDAVDSDGNIEPQGIDQAKLVPLLTKALQEAVAKIETLEAKVTALEGK